MNTYSSIARGLRTVASSGLLLALAITGVGPASAAPPLVHYTCVAEVSTDILPNIPGQSGGANLTTVQVTGVNIAQAAALCHAKTLAAFVGNPAWSNPTQFCLRYSQANYEMTLGNTGKVRRVWATDYFQELGHASGYNRVGGYSVVCNAPTNLIPVSGVTVVPSTL